MDEKSAAGLNTSKGVEIRVIRFGLRLQDKKRELPAPE